MKRITRRVYKIEQGLVYFPELADFLAYSTEFFPGVKVGQSWKIEIDNGALINAKRVKAWRYVLPATLFVVGAALISYKISLPTERAAFYTPSAAELTAVAGMFYQVEPDVETGRWIDYGDPAIYEAGGLGYVTPPVGSQPGQVEIEGVVFPNYACYVDAECREDWIRVAERDTWDSDPRYKLIATFSVPTETPTVTPTLTPEPIEVWAVNIYGENVNPQKGLNLRCSPTLYSSCNFGYMLPYCGYVTDGRDCNPVKDSVILTEVVFVDGGYWHREDSGWWGKWGDGWIAMCLDARDYDFVDVCGE